MPLNEKKIIAILLAETALIEERCEGYREELVNAVTDILEYERQHRVHGTNIQQKISDKCSASGRYLAERSNVSDRDSD